ncbi:hypothetical protein [Streptomyces sp. NBC_01006]|uniref:hypothetical protein n=1 Tax=Streptomyces sp. NBC_01006 TaxID=2903716 RepID=UPI00386696A5|nr:hypothetical protein OG509_02665 [Streptomyces sp. NBC_01006]
MTVTDPAGSPVRRHRALLVPLLAAVSAGLLAARTAFDSDTFQHCHYLGPSTRMYVTSWAGVACGLGALLLYAAWGRAAQRSGPTGEAAWQRWLAGVSALLTVPVVLLLVMSAYWLYAPDPSGGYDCSGLHPLIP